MNTSLISAAKPFLSQTHSLQYHRKATNFTCRATNLKHPCNNSESSTNFYNLLSLSPNITTSKDEIKRAYRSMALRYHPDVCHDPLVSATEEFVQLNQAYKTLSDPVLREEYDFELGLRNSCAFDMEMVRNRDAQNRWRQQILELKRRSSSRMAQKEGSWASRMRRAHNIST